MENFTCNLKLISDIDECLVDAHNCSSDAFCINTHESFNCTCKPGFTGDGKNCTGSILSGQRVFHPLPLLQLACYSNATTVVDPGELDWEASHPSFLSRLTCLLEQFNWHFIPVLSA